MENPGTVYADYVQIFCSIDYIYTIGIMDLTDANNKFSKNTKAIIWYV